MIFKGFCLGATTISLVTLQKEKTTGNIEILETLLKSHEGELRRTLLELLQGDTSARLCATGRKFRRLLSTAGIPEPEAVELAYEYCCREARVDGIVSAGGETIIYYELDKNGRIGNVQAGSKCASGTGEFFLQQIKRMGLGLEEALTISEGEEPYPVAGRCSVFCKSDCTHALNKGEKKGKVVAGLCRMIAGKIVELVQKSGGKRILLIGGMAGNKPVVNFLGAHMEVIIPREAAYFEALGAALWAALHEPAPVLIREETLFLPAGSSFSFLPPLAEARKSVSFKKLLRGEAAPGERLILGLDVGSTTTKAVLLRERDKALVASIYLRTEGDPVRAARQCYASLAREVFFDVHIIGLGVTGSGRQIAALHALTPAVINEIIAHARAALFFDGQVDTIFEIGGQDAKYTYIVNGVPADYAMNEACSAGTGSFLEESAFEALDVEMTGIAPLALQAVSPPNFNDQCAAFISSDIKTAVQEGLGTPDILAGLVYSICLNYLNRVKGNRPVGKKIFMQGGVCYNQAVPVAMAGLLEKEIVVPPEPGLMGAFGVALDVAEKIGRGSLPEGSYNLQELAGREIEYGKPFTCRGDKSCDRRCLINVLKIEGKRYPFGGACSRYTGVQRQVRHDVGALDLVFQREQIIYRQSAGNRSFSRKGKKLGISRSLLVNTLFPLYFHYFSSLGFEVITPSTSDPLGRLRQGAPFCFPVELGHGYMADLLRMEPDYIFVPHVKALPSLSDEVSIICPLAQGEPYYLKAAFADLQDSSRVLSPVLDFSHGYSVPEQEFVEMGKTLGATQQEAREAFCSAVRRQEQAQAECKQLGRGLLAEMELDSAQRAVVLFGRSYSAFTEGANLGIPHKFASRGWKIIPCDFLPLEEEEPFPSMYWSNGQIILQAAELVCKNPRFFGVYITNFSCGPDSFLVGYFRSIMGEKPSLTLELDGHTSDAGLDTRIEAFLDIVEGYLETMGQSSPAKRNERKKARPVTLVDRKKIFVRFSEGDRLPLSHPHVKVLVPSMGANSAPFLSAAMNRWGIRAIALPPPGNRELKLGRSYSTCKECLPLQLTVGSLLRYLEEVPLKPEDRIVYFMPDASGPCRFGQYQVFINRLLESLQIDNVTTFSLSAENGYGGLGTAFSLRLWVAVIFADVLSEIYSSLLVLGADREEALAVYNRATGQIAAALAVENWGGIKKAAIRCSEELARVKRTGRLDDYPKIALLGEIYVRSDDFSRQHLVEFLAEEGIITKVASINEWLYYCDYLVKKGIAALSTPLERWKNSLQTPVKRWIEREIKKIFFTAGLSESYLTRVDRALSLGENFISPHLTGEAILTLSTALAELVEEVSGVIALGPFGCMPNRVAEAVGSRILAREEPPLFSNGTFLSRVLLRHPHLPFMAVETDGNVFPQVVEARLESFILQVKRLHQVIREEKL